MSKFIEKTNINADIQFMLSDLNHIINLIGWPEPQRIGDKFYSGNQIGLKCRKDCKYPLLDGIGSTYDKEKNIFLSQESDFTEYVDIIPEYTKNIIMDLEVRENIKFGRIRLMRLLSKNGLSVHKDLETRYHYVYETNPNAFFGERLTGEISAQCFHIPNDGYFYKVDTTREHFVYNGGWEPRIHLVCNVING